MSSKPERANHQDATRAARKLVLISRDPTVGGMAGGTGSTGRFVLDLIYHLLKIPICFRR